MMDHLNLPHKSSRTALFMCELAIRYRMARMRSDTYHLIAEDAGKRARIKNLRPPR